MIGAVTWSPMYVITVIVGSLSILTTLIGYWSERRGRRGRAGACYRSVCYACLLLMSCHLGLLCLHGDQGRDLGFVVAWALFAYIAHNESRRVAAG